MCVTHGAQCPTGERLESPRVINLPDNILVLMHCHSGPMFTDLQLFYELYIAAMSLGSITDRSQVLPYLSELKNLNQNLLNAWPRNKIFWESYKNNSVREQSLCAYMKQCPNLVIWNCNYGFIGKLPISLLQQENRQYVDIKDKIIENYNTKLKEGFQTYDPKEYVLDGFHDYLYTNNETILLQSSCMPDVSNPYRASKPRSDLQEMIKPVEACECPQSFWLKDIIDEINTPCCSPGLKVIIVFACTNGVQQINELCGNSCQLDVGFTQWIKKFICIPRMKGGSSIKYFKKGRKHYIKCDGEVREVRLVKSKLYIQDASKTKFLPVA